MTLSSPITIAFPYDGDRFGGSNVSSLILAAALRARGHTIHVITHGDGRARSEAEAMGFKVHILPRLSRTPAYARPDRFRLGHMFWLPRCKRALRDVGADVVHTNDLAMLRAWVLPARMSGVPLLAHWRSAYSRSWSIDAGLAFANAVVAVSHYARRQLPTWAQRKTSVSYNGFHPPREGLDAGQCGAAIRARLGVPDNSALIGTFGNHSVRKRTHVLADILAGIHTTARGRPVFGLACGARAAPHDRLLDEKIATFGLERRLLRPGFVRPVDEWMAACDVLVAPSIQEPLARTVLEAHSLGVPVIASSDGGLSELVEDGRSGFVCAPDDFAGWIKRTRDLLDDDGLRRRLADAARKVVVKLTPERNAHDVECAYARIIQPQDWPIARPGAATP